jgi:uncharacterized protein (TIGR02246 family)
MDHYPKTEKACPGLCHYRNVFNTGTVSVRGTTMQETQQAITSMLKQYEQSLNTSDTDAVMKLYTNDGVFMPQHFPSSVGLAAVREAYEAVFGAIRLTVKFDIQEVRTIAPDWAFARTNSAGTVLIHSSGESSAEANQELFVLRQVDGAWKIARYCFSTTNPPKP